MHTKYEQSFFYCIADSMAKKEKGKREEKREEKERKKSVKWAKHTLLHRN